MKRKLRYAKWMYSRNKSQALSKRKRRRVPLLETLGIQGIPKPQTRSLLRVKIPQRSPLRAPLL